VRDYSPVIGLENAPVTIVEFFDPSCEGCRAMYPYVKEILAEYPDNVRLVLRYVLFHGGSEEAVRILEAARNQLNSSDIDEIIKQDMGDVQSVKIKGTPTFYVNGQQLSKLGPQELYDMVKSEVDALN